jgi:hypothetical protein
MKIPYYDCGEMDSADEGDHRKSVKLCKQGKPFHIQIFDSNHDKVHL